MGMHDLIPDPISWVETFFGEEDFLKASIWEVSPKKLHLIFIYLLTIGAICIVSSLVADDCSFWLIFLFIRQ